VPNQGIEKNKLTSSNGWNLPGVSSGLSRTRGKKGVLEPPPTTDPLSTNARPTDVIAVDSSATTPSTISAGTEPNHMVTGLPPPSRSIFDLDGLKALLERNIACGTCNSAVNVTFPTCCLASGVKVACTDPFCMFVDACRPAMADMPVNENGGSALIERQTDYAINILWVLGFLTSGDGGTEAGRLMGLLGLPHSTSMQKRFFSSIESRISPHIVGICDEVLHENLQDEVKLHYNNKRNDEGVLLFDLWLRKELPSPADWPKLPMSTDMAWQKRSSGKRYDSLSGHALLCTTTFRKPAMQETLAKSCCICKLWHLKHLADEPAPEHICTINHTGSSGSMEPIAVLNMAMRLYRVHNVVASPIITDDDSSIKAKLKWSNADHMTNANTTTIPKIINSNGNEVTRPDKGELPADVAEPAFLAVLDNYVSCRL